MTPRPDLSRRRFLQTAALGAGAVAAVRGLPASAATVRPAAVSDTGSFDLTAGSQAFLQEKLTYSTHHTMQSFCFDPHNQHLFTISVPNGQTPDSGYLTVSRMSYDGTVTGHMDLGKLGHGVSMACENTDADSYLWTEHGWDASTQRGTGLQRFKFVDGGKPSLTYAGNPTPGVNVTPSIDHWNRLFAVRYSTGSGFYYDVYPLDDANAGNFGNRLTRVAEPSGLGTFQGWTIFGSHLYILEGTAYSSTNTDPGNTKLTKINANTGTVEQFRVGTSAFHQLPSREPEGMAGYIKANGEHRLYFGFVTHTASEDNRYISLAYKNQFS